MTYTRIETDFYDDLDKRSILMVDNVRDHVLKILTDENISVEARNKLIEELVEEFEFLQTEVFYVLNNFDYATEDHIRKRMRDTLALDDSNADLFESDTLENLLSILLQDLQDKSKITIVKLLPQYSKPIHLVFPGNCTVVINARSHNLDDEDED